MPNPLKNKRRRFRRPWQKLAGWTGLEPATSGVTGQHSNQLNYHSALGLLTAGNAASARRRRLSNHSHSPTKNKGAVSGAFGKTRGVDGTRTRDLRRDRPA